MIKEVIPGEKLTAKTQNEIIQACNGLMQPAGKFVNTPNGSLYPNPTPQFNNMLGRCVETLFQLKFELKQHLSKRIVDEQTQKLTDEYSLSSVWYGYSINLGNDYAQLKDQVRLMQPDNDDIFIIGGLGVDGSGDSENGDRLSVHLAGTPTILDGSDKEGFFDLGVYWKSPFEGCPEIEVQKLTLSSDNPQYGPRKNAFVIRGKNYPSQSVVEDWYENKYGDTWTVTDSSTTTVGYVYNQKLVQLRTGILFPETAKEWVDSQLCAVQLSSIQERSYGDFNYHQMFNFDQRELSDFVLSDQNDCDIVIRDYKRDRVPRGACVNYVKVHDFLSATRYDVDTDATQGDQRSLEVVQHGGDIKRDYLQLYDFDNQSQNEFLECGLVYGQPSYVVRPGQQSDEPDSQIQFVCRDYSEQGQDGQIVYDGIKIYAPKPSAYEIDDLSSVVSAIVIDIDPGHECSCDISALSAKVDELSSELSDRWKCGGTYDDNCYGYSIGDSSQRLAIDIDEGDLWYGSSQTLDWHACELYDSNGSNGPGNICMNWFSRIAYNSSGFSTIDWENCKLYESTGSIDTIDWENCYLRNPSDGANAVDWGNRMLNDANTYSSVEWGNRYLMDSSAQVAVDWEYRQLRGNWTVMYGELAVEGTATFKIGNTTLSEAQLSALLALI